MRRRRRREGDDRDANATIYVHLALDGGIFVIRGDTGEELWVDRAGLAREIDRIKEKPGASLLYSREAGQTEPPSEVRETFQAIADYALPIQLLEEPHPSALAAPEQRRNLTRD